MINFVCKHCNFRFSSQNPSECPYCGRNTLEKEKSAEELLNDIDKILEN